MRTFLSVAAIAAITSGCSSTSGNTEASTVEQTPAPVSKVVLNSEVNWEELNPARGDKSPKAGTLWGDRNGYAATGYLLNPVDGFLSPPHIHNINYRAIVIEGEFHNDDPNADDMWMPAGSVWTQPKGEVHVTGARGEHPVAYIEIEQGPYLVLPSAKKDEYPSDDSPMNIDESNIVWVDAADITWLEQSGVKDADSAPKVAFLWGDMTEGKINGTFIKLPAGFKGELRSEGTAIRAITVKGNTLHQAQGSDETKMLEPGSFFGSDGQSVHQLESSKDEESIIYIRTNGKYRVVPV
ncbi:DUF4437 domain-containing protein [Vibrio sp. JC009]|uniref:DUF4437 domain-containing protein n=1 Tax=Vibrio sp. JC009 TaxID=2912314 RepID=UPI0023B1C652|nr:DUF4437 domain-containing protein [Vibrio sp. JC009]WED24443.1 DUF4437 domain-containing protein [Vibrio sp. JC009]